MGHTFVNTAIFEKSSIMFLIYSDKITNRVRYAFHLLMKDVLQLGDGLEFTSDFQHFEQHKGPGINYSNKQIEGKFNLMAARLLFETGITEQKIAVTKLEEYPIFFTTSARSVLPFDPFAAAFYMATRYEEYLPHRSDNHARFPAEDSLAYRNNFLKTAVVNRWGVTLQKALLQLWPQLVFEPREYAYTCTIDIDNAWTYKEKGMMRTSASLMKALVTVRFKELTERLRVLFGKEKDPYDTYSYLLEKKQKYRFSMIYFFLLADYGPNDKNVLVNSSKFHSLVKSLSDYAKVGIHPSYGSNTKPERLSVEIKRLAKITNREVIRSRQHFLKLSFPETYRRLIELDIVEDHTMGFASAPGFRAGLCTPYHHYDLDQESLTPLVVYPFAVMDGTLNEYMALSPDEATAVVNELIEEVKSLNGHFISLWHNETLNDRGKWKGWQAVFDRLIEAAV